MNKPPDPPAASLGELVDEICDRFEDGWLAGTSPNIESFVRAAPEPVRAWLFRELLSVEREYRERAGRPVTLREARDRFAGLGPWSADIIDELIAATGSWTAPVGPEVFIPPDRPDSRASGRSSTIVAPEAFPRDLDSPGADLPEAVGKYRVLGLLGRGGMGVVYLAEHPKLSRTVAIKVMALELAARTEVRVRFLREAQAAAKVRHDNVVVIHDVDESGGIPFIVMEHLQGQSLEDLLRAEPALSVPHAVRIAREVAEGLVAAATAGIVHRDVKPANIWLEGDPSAADWSRRVERVKVLDFGLARAADGADGLTVPGTVLGTPAYMAPEQAAGKDVDGRADLFSLGCVLYRMLAGRSPFAGTTVMAVLNAVATHHPPPPCEVNPAVPAKLSTLVMKLLDKDPAHRPRSADETVSELRGLDSDVPVVQPAVSAARRSWFQVWRRVVIAALVLFVFVTTALVGRNLHIGWVTPSTAGVTRDTNLVIRVRRAGFEEKPLGEVVPLLSGDSLQARFRVPAGSHVSLVYVNGCGRLALLQSYLPGETAYEAIWPGAGEGKPLTPPAGTEFLFVCGRGGRPAEIAELQAAWDATAGWPALEPKGRVLRLRPDGIVYEGIVGRDFGASVEFPDGEAVKRRLEHFRTRLRDFPVLDGVAFRHE